MKSTFTLGKPKGESHMLKPGKPIIMDGDGRIAEKECKDLEDAVREAKRLARKIDDDVYVYVAVKIVSPNEPTVTVEDVK